MVSLLELGLFPLFGLQHGTTGAGGESFVFLSSFQGMDPCGAVRGGPDRH